MATAFVSRAAYRKVSIESVLGAVLIVGLLAGVTAMIYVTGGTQTALPHLFYVPIMASALLFGSRGALAAAVLATLLCGPLMPLDAGTGQAQQLLNWVSRGAFFVIVGSLAGEMLKFKGRGYENELRAKFEREMQLASDVPAVPEAGVADQVREVLENRWFYPVFQPIYGLADGHLIAVEALTRFTTSPQRSPDQWFADAAGVGLGRELELATVELALEASEGLADEVALSVNCSPDTLTDPRFRQMVCRYSHRRLTVEVTEHAVVNDYAHLARAVEDLRSLGIGLAVDDVGAGISSLRHIVRLAPDTLKLDISLTQHLHEDRLLRVLADCLIQFASKTGSVLIAEGIEEQSDLEVWRSLGATAVQGYLLGRPGPLPVPAWNADVRALRHGRTDPPKRVMAPASG